MDVDFRSSRVQTAKHLTAMQASRFNSDNRLCLDDSEGDDDAGASFPCPFCYVDIELPVLCPHLQEEHCFDVKNAVCPLCAANLGKDMIGHFTLQHTQLLKRRRKSQKSGLWPNNSPSSLSKELQGLASFLGVSSPKDGVNTLDSAPGPVVSSFQSNVAPSENKSNTDTSSRVDASTTSALKSIGSSTSDKAREEEYKERSQQAEFFRQLVMSTIF